MSKSDSRKDELRNSIYSPEQAFDNTVAVAEERKENPQIGFIPYLPGYILNPSHPEYEERGIKPWYPGMLAVFGGYTSMGKSTLVQAIMRYRAQQLIPLNIKSWEQGLPSRVIAYFDWENTVEMGTALQVGRFVNIDAARILSGNLTDNEMHVLKSQGRPHFVSFPIYRIGHSIKDKRTRPVMSMADVLQVLIILEDEMGLILDLITLDYLQRAKRMVSDSTEALRMSVDSSKDFALRSPTILVTQTNRPGNDDKDPMPSLDKGQGTSNLEQSADFYLNSYLPIKYQKAGKTLKYYGTAYEVQPNLIVTAVQKQKMGAAPIIGAMEFGYGGTYLKPWTKFVTEKEKK